MVSIGVDILIQLKLFDNYQVASLFFVLITSMTMYMMFIATELMYQRKNLPVPEMNVWISGIIICSYCTKVKLEQVVGMVLLYP